MSSVPPVLPEKTLENVIRIGRRDGTTVLAVSGLFALISAAWGDIWGAAVGLIIAGSGVFEMHGAKMLQGRRANGISWLVSSQLYLMFAVLGYCAWRLHALDEEEFRKLILSSAESRDMMNQMGVSITELIRGYRILYVVLYSALAILTFIYQGGMALFFMRRRKAAVSVLGEDAAHGENPHD